MSGDCGDGNDNRPNFSMKIDWSFLGTRFLNGLLFGALIFFIIFALSYFRIVALGSEITIWVVIGLIALYHLFKRIPFLEFLVFMIGFCLMFFGFIYLIK